jgi:hypothetical protein
MPLVVGIKVTTPAASIITIALTVGASQLIVGDSRLLSRLIAIVSHKRMAAAALAPKIPLPRPATPRAHAVGFGQERKKL